MCVRAADDRRDLLEEDNRRGLTRMACIALSDTVDDGLAEVDTVLQRDTRGEDIAEL
jgi:hypothetical protein